MLRAEVTGPPCDLFVVEKSTVPRAGPPWMTVGQEIGRRKLFQIGMSDKSRLQHFLNGYKEGCELLNCQAASLRTYPCLKESLISIEIAEARHKVLIEQSRFDQALSAGHDL